MAIGINLLRDDYDIALELEVLKTEVKEYEAALNIAMDALTAVLKDGQGVIVAGDRILSMEKWFYLFKHNGEIQVHEVSNHQNLPHGTILQRKPKHG